MQDITPRVLSSHFTRLLGRQVGFEKTLVKARKDAKVVYGVYKSFPSDTSIVVGIELSLVASFAGALIGLPEAEVQSRCKAAILDEVLSDAILEIFNVAAAVVTTEDRSVFIKMFREGSEISEDVAPILSTPHHQSGFRVSVADYAGGMFQVLS